MNSQDEALIETTRDVESLGELLDYCDSLKVCNASAEFWKASLSRLFGNIMILQRGDLETAEEWYQFALLLLEGKNYKYSLGNDGGVYEEVPKPIYAQPKHSDSDVYYESFDIPAMVPTEGTRGYLARVMINGGYFEELTTFFVHSDLKKAKENALRFAGEEVHRIINQQARTSPVTQTNTIRIKTEWRREIYNWHEIKIPPAKDFVDALFQDENVNWYGAWTDSRVLEVRFETNIAIKPITF